jgi:hypothetical protein
MEFPLLLNNYLKFCNLRSNYNDSGVFDLGIYHFYHPITLLPVLNFIIKNSIDYVQHPNPMVQNYISIVGNPLSYHNGKSYVPVERLPNERGILDEVLQRIINLAAKSGGLNAFGYAIYELVENIYEHSEFNSAYVMAQKYSNFVDICILDDGISIPSRISTTYEEFNEEDDYKAIAEALNGLSTKDDDGRGFGLSSTTNLFVKGLNSQIMIISRYGACYIDDEGTKYYSLYDNHKWDGTIIGLRVFLPIPKIDIYKYI